MSEPLVIPTADVIDGKSPCPDCGVYYQVTNAGTLRKHNCPGVLVVEGNKGTAAKAPARKRGGRKPAPDRVRKVFAPIIASGVETGARQVFSRAVPCKPEQIPDEVVELDAMEMVAPLLDLLWPAMPSGAQKIAVNIAEQEDLIVCALAWWDWFKTLRTWTEQMSQILAAQALAAQQPAYAMPTVMESASEPTSQASSSPSYGAFAGAEPFQPVSDGLSEAV